MDDTIVQQELVRNERFVTHSRFGELRLRRPTPAMDALISNHRRKVYHADLKNPEILTREEIQNILRDRGVWSPKDDDKLKELTLRSGDLMARLNALGYDAAKSPQKERRRYEAALKSLFPEGPEEVLEAIGRICIGDGFPEPTDINIVRAAAESSDIEDLLLKINTLEAQEIILTDFVTLKTELNKMMETYTKFFGDTIEERASRAERMAHIFYCITTKAESKCLWDKFEDMWDEEAEDVAWLHNQLFFFQNGIDAESGETLQAYGFIARAIDTGAPLEDSQDLPTTNLDGESVEKDLETSLEPETVTT